MAKAIPAFIIPSLYVLFKNLDLDLNDSESAIVFFDSSLQNWHKNLEIFEQLPPYYIKLYIGIITSRPFALSNCVLFILVIQSVNSA